jgi:hypothetical protein
MYSYNKEVRAALRLHPDGLTTAQINSITKAPQGTIRNVLKAMPDAYIDRWSTRGTQNYLSAVWCVVIPPDDCPKPEKASSTSRANREIKRV